LDVAVTVFQVGDYFLEVLQHQVFVVQQLLCLNQAGILTLGHVLSLLEDGHRVEVFLAEEQDVETCLLEVLHGERKCAFSEDWHD